MNPRPYSVEVPFLVHITLHAGFDYRRVESVRITGTSKKERSSTATSGCHQNHRECGTGPWKSKNPIWCTSVKSNGNKKSIESRKYAYSTRTCTDIYIYVHIHIYIYIHTCIYIYIYIHIHCIVSR